MNKTLRKIVCLLLVCCMLFSLSLVLTSCGDEPEEPNNENNEAVINEGDYTYRSWATSLGTNWNPHTWEMSGDSAIMGYIESPLVTIEALNTKEGTYQWVYEMATSIEDVTAAHQADLTKYGSTLPEGKTAADITKDYVYEIKLNPNAKWENGDIINADTYIYSMQMLLSSKMKNYRANNYISGTSALAGAMAYYNSESPLYTPVISYPADDPVCNVDDLANTKVYINLKSADMTIAGYSFYELANDYGIGDAAALDALQATANGYGYIEVTADNMNAILAAMDAYLSGFSASIYGEDGAVDEGMFNEFLFYISGYGDKVEWDTVGLYKVDDYTIRYVCNTAYELNYFLTSCTSNWIVHKATYEANMKEEAGLTVTTYGNSADNTMAYGPYKLQSFEDDKQIVFVQNPNWYGYQKTDSGYLYSMTNFKVDGETLQQYQTTKVIIDVLTQEVAYQKFLKGELTDYAPTAEELLEYVLSDRLYKVDETYTMRYFFNTNLEKLKVLDAGSNNDNSVVISNYKFRQALSLALNRADFVTATEGWKPAYSLMNSLYYYDIYNDPTSSYRSSEEAMQAICNLYGAEYGEDKIYKTLEEAYNSITGYNLTEAKNLMKEACEELVAANLYTAGQNIKIQIGWAKGALTAADNAQLAKLNEYVNAALAGSGFGSIEFVAVGNLKNRYADVAAGNYAIGWGAWGGAAFYPFGMFQVYMDPDYADIHEAGCWDPTKETLTLTFKGDNGETITDTMTWQKWSQSMEGTGKYAGYSNKVKLQILALLEENYLELYYCVPVAGTTVCTLLSYQVEEYTDTYNIMYNFGGFRIMSWNYNDAQWTEYVASQNGTLNYK